MKNIGFRLVIIVAAIALSVYLLYPTVLDFMNTKKVAKIVEAKRVEILKKNSNISDDQLKKILQGVEDSIKLNDPKIRDARLQRVKLGLDLQGGMRLVLEVNTAKLLEKLPNKPDDTYREILAEASKEAAKSNDPIVDIVVRKLKERNIRISRYFGSIRDDDDKIVKDLKKQTEDAVSRAMEIIRNRIDQYGVSEPSIQKQGDRRIIIELPGVAKEEEARQLLQGTALLEFKLLKEPNFAFTIMKKIDEVLSGKKLDDTTASDSTIAADSVAKAKETAVREKEAKKDTSAAAQEARFLKEHPFFALARLDPSGRSADAYVKADDREKLQRIFNREDVKKVIPNNVEFIFSAKPVPQSKAQETFYFMYLVNKTPELTGGVVTNATSQIDPNGSSPVVSMEMSGEGATQWARITGANIGKRCAIVLDNLCFSAPVIRNKITGGRSQIEGMADMQEAKLLEIVLKAGALPAPVEIIEERTVGPSLGQDSITKGVDSMLFGYLFIAIFMIVYYQRSGSIAAFGLALTILFLMAILAGFKASLTLPGIAGIVLTMGVAVDANVLIYERIREELAVGKTMKAAVDSGFARANSAIIDSNMTTLITGIILYQFGTGPVQGFALTLMIGIIASLFSALVVSRVILDYMINKGYKITVG
jgi:preprotein translocase subunit SecD